MNIDTKGDVISQIGNSNKAKINKSTQPNNKWWVPIAVAIIAGVFGLIKLFF